MPTEHIPVLAETLAERISLPTDGAMVDATVGLGGHSLLFGSKLGPGGILIGLDVDKTCINRAHINLSDLSCRKVLVRENFAKVAEVIAGQGVEKVDLLLADLGFCSAQLDDPGKGLSFQSNMRLDMRLDDRLGRTAADIVNDEGEKALSDLIYEFGEERRSRRIARFIVEYREGQPIITTGQLALVVCRAVGQAAVGRKSKIHPATRTFQALRIAVNDELGNLEKFLAAGPDVLKKGGYIAVISFHSLEDRIVKKDFKANAAKGNYEILTKKPIKATGAEVAANVRARSAKLRIARRL